MDSGLLAGIPYPGASNLFASAAPILGRGAMPGAVGIGREQPTWELHETCSRGILH